MTIIEKIKAEIEKRLKDYWKICFHDVKTYNEDSNVRELKELLSFLSTLESEKPVPNDIEEAAEGKFPVYWKDYPKDGIVRSESSYDTNKQCRGAFIAGAKWQKEHMMEEAVDTVVSLDAGGFPFIEFGVGKFGLKVGNKVRVIICKKED